VGFLLSFLLSFLLGLEAGELFELVGACGWTDVGCHSPSDACVADLVALTAGWGGSLGFRDVGCHSSLAGATVAKLVVVADAGGLRASVEDDVGVGSGGAGVG
jgi:hypothetical protein